MHGWLTKTLHYASIGAVLQRFLMRCAVMNCFFESWPMRNPLPRHIALPGTSNFRDLGGYTGAQGHSVRWRTVFRSDHLAGLTPEGVQQLQQLGVHRAADFRGVQERAADSYAWPHLQVHALSVEPTVVQKAMGMLNAGGQLSVEDTVAIMEQTYRSFVRDNATHFANFFDLLLQSDQPLVFHCTAGKDRTGWAAALFLEVLGVSRSDIQQDYLLTNQFYQRPAALRARAAQSIPQEVLDVVWRVQPAFLDSAYSMVNQEYGGMQTYLREVLQLDDDAQHELQQRYLQAE